MERPTGVTVFAIVFLIFGVLGIIGGAFTLVMLLAMSSLFQEAFSILGPGYTTYMLITTPISFFMTIVMLISGIGLLSLKPWSRTLALFYAIFSLAFGTVNLVIILFLFNFIADMIQIISAAGGYAFTVVFSVLILWYFTREDVKSAFALA